ncbi:unnamed protein product [Trichobilharzia regenti]|uniref:MKRN2 opposite strand protein n=1 Tax=Trichobilharzia regenti TaxID=157069 RepID=A0A183VJL9_TRIRE|nr:unnamed protein product [Trichobilharzia regenti]VDP95564.1 unnamed protein product [Trichobilharzia regenti]
MAQHKILALRHSCLNTHEKPCTDDDDDDDEYIFTLNSSPELCLLCNEKIECGETIELLPPVANAHVSIIFLSCPVARVAFILSDFGKMLSYHPGSSLHCGVVDSSGKVHSFTSHFGIRCDIDGWEESVVINVADVTQSYDLTSSKWDEIIYKCIHNQSFSSKNGGDETYDCLDFVIDIINSTEREENVNRISVASWLSVYLEHILLYKDVLKELLSGPVQVIRNFKDAFAIQHCRS